MKNIIKITALSLALLMALVLPVVAIGVSDAPLDSDNAWEAKIEEATLPMINQMSDDDILSVVVCLELFEDEVAECVAKVEEETGWNYTKLREEGEYEESFVSYVIAKKEAELGLEAGSLTEDDDRMDDAVRREFSVIEKRLKVVKREMMNEIKLVFIDTHISADHSAYSFVMYMIIADASKAEIISMAEDDRCTYIYFNNAEPQYPDPDESGDYGNYVSFDDIGSDINGEDTMSNEDIIIDNTTGEDTSVDNSSEEILDALYGDVNSDGAVDSLDAAQVLKHDASLITLEGDSFLVADINGDGVADSLDGAYILKIDAGLIQ